MHHARTAARTLVPFAALVALNVGCGGSTASSTSEPNGQPQGKGQHPVDCASADLQTSPEHCGACGHSCVGGACEAGVCQEVAVASTESNPFRVALAPDRVLWLSDGLHAFDYATHTARAIWTPSAVPRALATNGKDVVVALEDGTVFRVGLDGSAPTQVASGQDRVMAIRAAGDDYYWVNFGNSKLVHLPAGGQAEDVRNDLCFPTDVVVQGDHAFAFSGACRGILTAPLTSGGAASALFQDLGGDVSPLSGALAGASLAWINSAGSGDLRATALGDGTTRSLMTPGANTLNAAAGPITVTAVAADDATVYYATANERGTDDGRVYSVPVGGGTPSPWSSPEVTIRSVAADAHVVAWTAFGAFAGQGKIYLRAK